MQIHSHNSRKGPKAFEISLSIFSILQAACSPLQIIKEQLDPLKNITGISKSTHELYSCNEKVLKFIQTIKSRKLMCNILYLENKFVTSH